MTRDLTTMEKADYRRRLFATVEALPRLQRLILGLRYRTAGKSLASVARVLKLKSRQLVHWHEQRALAALRAALPRLRFFIIEEGGCDEGR